MIQCRNHLGSSESWIQWNEDGSEPIEAVRRDSILHTIPHGDGDAIAGLDSDIAKRPSEGIALRLKLGVGDALALMQGDHGDSVSMQGHDAVKMVRDGLLKKWRLSQR